MVAEVGETEEHDQIYRITFDGSVADEHGFVAMGGQADQVASVLKDRYEDGMALSQALSAALAALVGQGTAPRSRQASSRSPSWTGPGRTGRSAGSPPGAWRNCSPRPAHPPRTGRPGRR